MSDIECPYCGAQQDICHDDGYGYTENEKHEQECGECGKTFVFKTTIWFHYDAQRADCLNGAEHRLFFSKAFPLRYSKIQCKDCDYSRPATEEEIDVAMAAMKGCE